jgi:hypothetical protein
LIGTIRLVRRWWGSRCGCEPGGYRADAMLGLDGSLSPRLQEKVCRLAADVSFVRAAEHLGSLAGVALAAETVRTHAERKAAEVKRWQAGQAASADAFGKAEGRLEFTVDAGKVNTLERGWRDLKIAVVQKRPAAKAATPCEWQTRKLPPAEARVMWADIAPSERFRRTWRPRLKRLGLGAMADLHVLGDGASWIWRSADRALTGCGQTLDIYHACEHIAAAGKQLFGKGAPDAEAFLERGRTRLLEEGWGGICRLIGEEYARENTDPVRAALEPLTRYFAAHITRLGYRERLESGQAIGSGVVEGAAKTLGLRLKARGARWKHKNARAMAALVCARHGEEWSSFWSAAA